MWVKQMPQETTCDEKGQSSQMILKDLNYFYVGSLVVWGECSHNFHTDNQSKELYQKVQFGGQTLKLAKPQGDGQVQVKIPFASFFYHFRNKKNLGKIRFFCCVKKRLKNSKQRDGAQKCDHQIRKLQKKLEEMQKGERVGKSKQKRVKREIEAAIYSLKLKKDQVNKLAKKFIPIRMEIFIGRKIFNEKDPSYTKNLKKLDQIQTLLNTMKASSEQYKNLKRDMDELITNELYVEKLLRSLLLYLMEKAHVKVLNRSFVKPPPKLNFLMREYRRETIGLITKNKRAQYRIQRKIRQWKQNFQYYGLIYPCIGPLNERAFTNNYYPSLPRECLQWDSRNSSKEGQEMLSMEILKFKAKNNKTTLQESNSYIKKLKQNQKRVMDEIGAYGFEDEGEQKNDDDSDTDGQDENQASKKSMDVDQYKMMKRNQALMEKFETENKYFNKHLTPPSMISQLKPYQSQALQWMKYREGKISVEDLFQQSYKDQITDFEFERKLSPFWQEVELISGDKFYVNYLTGEFTQKFHDWKSIKGGILADEMGLGKTVMTLSLLADQNFEGLNLIVVPVAVLLQWKDQIRKHCGQHVLVYEFHSNAKNRRKVNLKEYQIILITYATLGHEWKQFSIGDKQNGQKFIFDYEFQRVILDEAHNIRGTNTLQFGAVMNLKSNYSWCLTGTLIQNSEQDLFAIFRFLRVEVFSQESWWNQYIKNAGCTQAKLNVIQTVLRPIVLRRTKASTSNQGEAILQLTKKNEFVIKPQFTKIEASIYQKLETGVKNFFRSNIQAGKNYTHVFQIICKLRQFCCHPALIFGENTQNIDEKSIQNMLHRFLEGKVVGKSFKDSAVSAILNGQQTCVICLNQPDDENAVLTQCGHYFCEPCIKRTMNINPHCPICRGSLTAMSYIKKADLNLGVPEQLNNVNESSKVTAILKTIQQIYQRGEKCVIFTQWIKIIAILEEKLLQKDIEFAVIMGNMTPEKRQRAIRRFRDRDSCRFLIVSIRAGATGLNLAFANNVIICDPWWNPSHEDQAVGRVHRLGQTQDVNVYRFIMKNSIEQKIERMHESKRRLANQVMMQKGSLQEAKTSAAQELIKLLQS